MFKFIMKFLGRIPKTWWLVGVLFASSTTLGWRLASAHQKIGELRSGVEQVKQVNAGNQEVIDSLESRIDELIAARVAEKEAAQVAVEAARERQRQVADELEAERLFRENLYENNPQASDWADQPVPPAIADRLRVRTNY